MDLNGTCFAVRLCRVMALSTLLASPVWLGGCASAKSKGAPWTILCAEIQGPNRAEIADRVVDSLKHTPGVRDEEVFWRDGSDETARIYYGRYVRPLDPKSNRRTMPEDFRNDIDYIKGLSTDDGRRLFLGAMAVRMPQQDVGNPAWALRRAEGAYTLQVAVFEPTETFWQFKQAAADYCALLREEGYEAYYHHDESSSIVTVGVFGEDAIRLGPDNRSYYSAEVRKLQQDPKLAHNLVNGHLYKVKADDGSLIAMPSRLVQLPGQAEKTPW